MSERHNPNCPSEYNISVDRQDASVTVSIVFNFDSEEAAEKAYGRFGADRAYESRLGDIAEELVERICERGKYHHILEDGKVGILERGEIKP